MMKVMIETNEEVEAKDRGRPKKFDEKQVLLAHWNSTFEQNGLYETSRGQLPFSNISKPYLPDRSSAIKTYHWETLEREVPSEV